MCKVLIATITILQVASTIFASNETEARCSVYFVYPIQPGETMDVADLGVCFGEQVRRRLPLRDFLRGSYVRHVEPNSEPSLNFFFKPSLDGNCGELTIPLGHASNALLKELSNSAAGTKCNFRFELKDDTKFWFTGTLVKFYSDDSSCVFCTTKKEALTLGTNWDGIVSCSIVQLKRAGGSARILGLKGLPGCSLFENGPIPASSEESWGIHLH